MTASCVNNLALSQVLRISHYTIKKYLSDFSLINYENEHGSSSFSILKIKLDGMVLCTNI